MPRYDYKCTKCNMTFDEFLPIDRRREWETKKCPCGKAEGVVKMVIGSPKVVSGHYSSDNRPDWFRDRLKEIHKANPGSKLNP